MSSLENSYRNQPRRRFSREFKREVVELLQEEAATVAEVARTYDLHPNQLFRWRTEYLRGAYGTVREVPASGTKLLPIELIDTADTLCVVSRVAQDEKANDPMPARRLRRLKVVLPKGQIHLEDVDTDTLGMLIEALR